MKFDAPDKAVGPKPFVKLGDGGSVVGFFRGDIKLVYKVFENGKYKTVEPTDANAIFRFNVNFITRDENGALVAKIFEGNWHDYKTLEKIHKEFDLEKVCVEITQTGERQSKRISFMPMRKIKPNEVELKKVELQVLGSPSTTPNMDDDGFDQISDEDIPF